MFSLIGQCQVCGLPEVANTPHRIRSKTFNSNVYITHIALNQTSCIHTNCFNPITPPSTPSPTFNPIPHLQPHHPNFNPITSPSTPSPQHHLALFHQNYISSAFNIRISIEYYYYWALCAVLDLAGR